jgi:hypothetical protein
VGDFYFGVRCGSRVWFLLVCACVLGVKIGFVFLALVLVWFLGLCGVCGAIKSRNSSVSLSERLEV